MTEDEFNNVNWVYVGERFYDKKIHHIFASVDDLDDIKSFSLAAASAAKFVIGEIYSVPWNEDSGHAKMGLAERLHKHYDDEDKIVLWRAESSAARAQKGAEAALKAAKREERDINQMTLAQAKEFIYSARGQRTERIALVLKTIGVF